MTVKTLNEDELRAACEEFVAAINQGHAQIVAAFTQIGLLGLGARFEPAFDRDGDSVWLDHTGEISWLRPNATELSGWRRLYVRDEAGS